MQLLNSSYPNIMYVASVFSRRFHSRLTLGKGDAIDTARLLLPTSRPHTFVPMSLESALQRTAKRAFVTARPNMAHDKID